MKPIIALITILFSSYLFYSCDESVENDPEMSQKIAGCWRGGIVQNDRIVERDLELRLISFRADSSLELSAIYELGPRSRVWEYSFPINCKNNKAIWLAHEGRLSQDCDTMYVEKNWKGDASDWMFIRDRGSEAFMNRLMSSENPTYIYNTPEEFEDGWPTESLNNVSLDENKITQLVMRIKQGKYGDIHSLVLCRNGKLVLDEYFALNGVLSGDFVNHTFRGKVHHLASTTKGIFSLLVGVAMDKYLFTDINSPISNYLPQYEKSFTGKSRKIRISDLLTMRSGWEWEQFRYGWDDKRNNAANMYICDDVIKYVIERPMKHVSGTVFNYSNADPVVLGVVLENASEMMIKRFAEQYIFGPLDISKYSWTHYPDGSLETDGGLALCSRDLAKIGQLVLQNGTWGKNQLISQKWIHESTAGRVELTKKRSYGYYWNEMVYEIGSGTEKAIFVPGDGGQFLAILPALDMIIVITAGNYNQDPTKECWNIIQKEIIPAVNDIGP